MLSNSSELVLEKTKTLLLLAAVEENNVNKLRNLLDSPKWYTVKYTKHGFSLLQFAITEESDKAFDYLLSLPDYPLEFENNYGETALMMLLSRDYIIHQKAIEYYSCELIKKGACIDKTNSDGNTLLHLALDNKFLKIAKILIEKGINLNVCNKKGFRPLELVNRWDKTDEFVEIFTMLLTFGANPLFKTKSEHTFFESCVLRFNPKLVDVLEVLFYYSFDEYSDNQIDFDILLSLAVKFLPVFDELIKQSFKIIIVSKNFKVNSFVSLLSSINSDVLKIIIEKFNTFFRHYLTLNSCKKYADHWYGIPIENLNILFESNLRDEVMTFINTFNSSIFLENLFMKESDVSGYLCYLLSYGFEIAEFDFYVIYKKYGYCELLKILLHMDFTKGKYRNMPDYICYIRENYGEINLPYCIMPFFIINITKNLEDFLKNHATKLNLSQLKELTSYSSHPILNSMYEKAIFEKNKEKINLPKVPLLVDLARNEFRKYFVNRYEIKTTRAFYTILNSLPISPTYKKIITYETKLY